PANCFHATMLLQMCIPLSFAMAVLFTSKPFALNISEILHPKKLFRRCPRCNGLLVLGDEYSTTIFLPVAGILPYSAFEKLSVRNCSQWSSATERFRNPLMTLKAEKR